MQKQYGCICSVAEFLRNVTDKRRAKKSFPEITVTTGRQDDCAHILAIPTQEQLEDHLGHS